jgi:dihydrodipicolinate synthase/N-acetylneuraminate lyase
MACCMSQTPFTADNKLDEDGFRLHLRRMAEAGVAVYLASPGSGEGHALTDDELRRVYQIGVEECKGKVPVYANPPEARTGAQMAGRIRTAVDAGVDEVQIYPVDNGHGMKPTYAEQDVYYRDLLDGFDYPTAISVTTMANHITPILLLTALCKDYPQIVTLNIIDGLALGIQGALLGHANLVPNLCRSVFDSFTASDTARFSAAYTDLIRLNRIVERWGTNPRWIKMGMKILGLPGCGDGRVRKPYLFPPAEDMADMAKAFDAMGLRELEAAAG